MAPEPHKTPRASRVETAQIVLPGLTNVHGTIFGGMLMQWIDIAAGIAAGRHADGPVVTASMDRLHFLTPVHVGEVVIVQAQVNFAARTSMEVGVRVFSETRDTVKSRVSADGLRPAALARGGSKGPSEGPFPRRRQTTRAYLTFVAVDENGRPRPVPPLHLETAADKRRFADASRRRAVRLRERRAMKTA